jgi:hypothetical protein
MKLNKKLALHKETMRALTPMDNDQLAQLNGGMNAVSDGMVCGAISRVTSCYGPCGTRIFCSDVVCTYKCTGTLG